MSRSRGFRLLTRFLLIASAVPACSAYTYSAPAPPPAPAYVPVGQGPYYSPAELDRVVSPIALYPDPLLAQVLAAATYPDDIPDAARWADEHHGITGQDLAEDINQDQLPWDPSVQALLPFPSVLETMAADMPWTRELGDAFLAQHDAVMDAVQRMRHEAVAYGYLQSNPEVIVRTGPYIEILPADPAYIVVPNYNPTVVFFGPSRGPFWRPPIYWGFGIRIGGYLSPWGWGDGGDRFEWRTHTVYINKAPWGRRWDNRQAYVHPYEPRRYQGPRPEERHPIRGRSAEERGRERPSWSRGDEGKHDEGKHKGRDDKQRGGDDDQGKRRGDR